MPRVAIAVATQYGQTKKIADHIKFVLEDAGLPTTLFQIQNRRDLDSVPLNEYDAVIVGGPIYAGSFPSLLVRWTKSNVDVLNCMPTALFSVSLNAADRRPPAKQENARLLDQFLLRTGLQTRLSASLIGAVHYLKYGPLKRWVLRRICAANGGPTDTTRNHELTNWIAVTAFARAFADEISGAPRDEAAAQPTTFAPYIA